MENGKTGNRVNRSENQKCSGENRRKTGFRSLSPAAAVQPSDTSHLWSEPFSRPGLGSVYSASAFAMIFPVFTSGFLSIYGPPRPEFVCWRAEESKEEPPSLGRNFIGGFGDVNFLFHPRVFEAGAVPSQRNREAGKPICRRGHHAR
jgi:hypothetical protein